MKLETESKRKANESQKVEHERLREVSKIKSRSCELIAEIEKQAKEQIDFVNASLATTLERIAHN